MPTPTPQDLFDGSARIALKVEPQFTKYIFIEKDPKRFAELNKLKDEFPNLASDIVLINAESNSYLRDLYENRRWDAGDLGYDESHSQDQGNRSMDSLSTGYRCESFTAADAQISEGWQHRLDDFFGTTNWTEAFYEIKAEEGLFGMEAKTHKVTDFAGIAQFFVKRLETIFSGVAKNPFTLRNTAKTPLYLLCFAAGNERAKTAVKIPQDILKP